jgi:signal transduction histidine kinase
MIAEFLRSDNWAVRFAGVCGDVIALRSLVQILCFILWAPLINAEVSHEPLHFSSASILTNAGEGYTRPPYTLQDAALSGIWQKVALPHVAPHHISVAMDDHSMHTTVVWYRIHLPLINASGPFYLYIPRWKADGQIAVYADNHLLYQSHASMLWNGWNIPLWIALDETALMPREITVRIERPEKSGGGISSIWVGEEKSLSWRYHLRDFFQVKFPLMSSAAFLVLGLFSLFVWLRRRDQTLYLLFFCVSLTSFVRSMHFYLGAERLIISDEWFSWLTVNSLFWMIATVHFFLNYLHRHPVVWLNRIVIAVTLVVMLITMPYFTLLPGAYVLAPLVYVVLLVMGILAASTGLRSAWLSQSRDGVFLGCWALLGMAFGLYDWLLQNNYVDIEGAYLGSYSNIIAFLIFTYIMFRRYVTAIDDVVRVNASLEARLQEREVALTESHRLLREVEQRQTLNQERQRLMQDMHDGLGSSLVSALREVERGQLKEADVAQVLKGCIDDMKLAIDSLEPVEADLLMLLGTLRFRLGPRLENSGIELRWAVANVPPLAWLEPVSALHILRIVQEAFTNIVKHTCATQICVATGWAEESVWVTITDNGQGFKVEEALKQSGKGLSNQRQRAAAIGAEIIFDSRAIGTCMTLRLPLNLNP